MKLRSVTARPLLSIAVLVASPLLMAFHCKTAYPNWPASPPAPNVFDPPNFTASEYRANQQFVEPKLTEAGANAVLALGLGVDWADLEPCNACSGTNCTNPPVAWPPGWPVNDATSQHTETVGSQSYRCNFNFEYLDAFLDTHVDPYGSRTTRRYYVIQLAPVFYMNRRTPVYLNSVAFNTTKMKTSYHRLLDKAFPAVVTPHFVSGQNAASIGLGNEVNAFLNSQSSPTTAWDQYSNFITDAIDYINSASHLGITSTVEMVSTQWYGWCGLGDTSICSSGITLSDAQTRAKNLMAQTEALVVTYYPPTNLDTTSLGWRMLGDFEAMKQLNIAKGKAVALQEAGYPTTGAQSTQTYFVDTLFSLWSNYADYIGGISYHSVYDFPSGVFIPTGFYDNNGNAKSGGTNWTNFKNRMNTAPQ